jgi:DNA-binding HxlR family transcriptional regulator
MDKRKFSRGICPVGRGLALIGDAWSMLILRDVGLGMTRFDQFRASLGIAPNILARRLKALTAAGLLKKRRYSRRPPRDEYVITEAGRDFLPVLQVIGAWGRRHNGRGELSYVVDVETGAPVEPLVIDRRTGAPIGSRPLRLVQPEAPVARRQSSPAAPSARTDGAARR